MCGVWGATGFPSADLLRRLALENGRRGPHAWGYATAGETFRQPGPYHGDEIPSSVAIVGHHRLATSGLSQDWQHAERNQPIVNDGWCLTHNGVVWNVDQAQWSPDSRYIVDAVASLPGDARGRLETAVNMVDRRSPLALLLLTPEDMIYAIRRDGEAGPAHPLWFSRHLGSPSISSRPLTPDATLIPEGAITSMEDLCQS